MSEKKQILILGGSSFVGRHLAEHFIAQKNVKVTLFNRGQTNPDLFAGTSHIKGDRNVAEDIRPLAVHEWDVVIDVSCYFPHQLRAVLENINRPKQYMFISTCSVYDNVICQDIERDETAPTLSCSVDEERDESPQTYGQRKAQCEGILMQSGWNYCIFRPALIYGPYDPTDRLYYWLYQVQKTEMLLLPEGGARRFSLTYVNDLVQAVAQSIDLNIRNEVLNCISNPQMSIEQLVSATEQHVKKRPKKHNASADFLLQHQIQQWIDIPLWLNTDMYTYSNQKLLKELKMETTSLEKGLSSTIAYFKGLRFPAPKTGIPETKKQQLIDLLKHIH